MLRAAYPTAGFASLVIQPAGGRSPAVVVRFDLQGPDDAAAPSLAEALAAVRAAASSAYPDAAGALAVVSTGDRSPAAVLPVLLREPPPARVRPDYPAGSIDELAERMAMAAIRRRGGLPSDDDLHEATGWRAFQELYEGEADEVAADELRAFALARADELCGEQPAALVWGHVVGQVRPVARHFFPESEAAVLAGAAAEVRAILGKALAAVPAG